MARPQLRSRAFGRTTLAGTYVNDIKFIEELTLETERQMQSLLVKVNEQVADSVRASILDLDVYDTGATYESVSVVYPPSWSAQKQVRNQAPSKQAQVLGTKTLENYAFGKNEALKRRPSLRTKIKQIDERTGRRTKLAQSGLDYRDAPYNPIMNVGRRNLYSGIQVGTYYAILPHDGLGTHSAERDYENPTKPKGPRQFFTPHVRAGQEFFAMEVLKLERTVTGRLRLKK